MWLVGELNIAHEHIPAGGAFGGLDQADFLAMNPHGRIPVIMDKDGTIVWESHAILRYLAAQYGADLFWSVDAKKRATVDQWMDWSQTTLQPDFINGIFWAYYRTPESQRNWPLINANIKRVGEHLLLLDKILAEHSYLTGNKISLADICIGTLLYRYFELDIERPDIANVENWYKQLQKRPAYREHVMISFEDLKGRMGF